MKIDNEIVHGQHSAFGLAFQRALRALGASLRAAPVFPDMPEEIERLPANPLPARNQKPR